MPREAVLRRFKLRMNDKDVVLHAVRVVKDQRRHILSLVGNPFEVCLVRLEDKKVYAVSEDLGLFGLVKDIPEFMKRLLS